VLIKQASYIQLYTE